MKHSLTIRELLLEQLEGRQAHANFSQAIQGLTFKQVGVKVERVPYTIWELIEHIRIAQADILEFCRNPDYEELNWPQDYWPESSVPPSKKEYEKAVQEVTNGIEEMRMLVRDENNHLTTPFTHGSGQTLFREAMLIVDHNAYHIGQIILIRKIMGSW